MENKWEYYINIFEKRFEILHQEGRGEVNTIVIEHVNSISINQSITQNLKEKELTVTLPLAINKCNQIKKTLLESPWEIN